MSLGEKIMSSVQTVSHRWLEKRTSEGAVPSAGSVPVSPHRAGDHGRLRQAQSCVAKTMSLSSPQYVSEYLLGLCRVNFAFSIISSGYGLFLACPPIREFL